MAGAPKVTRTGGPGAGAVGGAANEAGAGFRAGVAAYIGAHILRGQPFADLALLPEAAIPRSFVLEADAAVDDIDITLTSGSALIQAKRRLDMASMKAAAEQWVKLADERPLDPERLRLVVTGAEATGEIKQLRKALERNRSEEAGGLTENERESLEKLRGFLAELPREVCEQALLCAVVWIADLEESDGLVAKLGQALLEPGVVVAGQGERAWNALRRHAHELARKRLGATLEDLIDLMAREELTLTEDAGGLAAARHRERQAKLEEYRARVRARGESLDLSVLGAALPPLPLDEIDASVSVYEVPAKGDGGDEDSGNGGLAWALRRRGRALLLGLPGSGKSVALQAAAAHYAARPDWPLPIVASLQRVGRRLDSKGFSAALLEVAFENEPLDDQAALRDAATELLRRGDLAIFLDGLDESRSACTRIVAGLREALDQSDLAPEVLLSTRDVAYSHAHTLGFSDLRLAAPDRPEDTVRAILRASAEQRRLEGEEKQAWIEARWEWVRTRLDTDSKLRETPLMVALLTLAAADHDDDQTLPRGRAEVLRRVVDDVIGRWETGHRIAGETARMGSLEGGEAVHAAKASFAPIGELVYRDEGVSAAEATPQLAAMLEERFGQAPAAAEVAAAEALALWDEAGVFIGEGSDRRIRTRIQLFGELAHALTVCERSQEDQRDWALKQAEGGKESQPLLLAAGLSPTVVEALATWVVEDPDAPHRLEICGKAIDQGASLGDDLAETLVERLLEAEGVDQDQLWNRAQLLVKLPVAANRQPQVLAFFDRLRGPQCLIARVLASESWLREDDEVEHDLDSLLEADPAGFMSARGKLGWLGPDPDYQQAILTASRQLLTEERTDLARLVADRMRSAVSIRVSGQLRRLLVERGFSGVVADAERKAAANWESPLRFAEMLQEGEETDRELVEIIAGFAEPDEALDRISRRRLNRLVALMKTTRFAKAAAGDATHGVQREQAALAVAMRVAAQRGDVDLRKLAAEAVEWLAVREAEEGKDRFGPLFMLNDGGIELELGTWRQVSDPVQSAVDLATAVGSRYQWIGLLATRCLLRVAPATARDAALARLEELLERTTAAPQRAVALAISVVSPEPTLERFATDERPMARRAAAWLAREGSKEELAVLRRLLGDPDGGVRKEAAETVEQVGLAGGFSAELEAAAENAEGWQCLWCGHENGPVSGRCAQCELSSSLLGIPPAEPISLAVPAET
jgi:hypothetical protein